MRKILLLLLGAMLICCVSCSKDGNDSLSDLKGSIWKRTGGSITIVFCGCRDGQYCDNCYGWKASSESTSYYVFRENNVGYIAYHTVQYWKNKEGAPYYNYPDRHTVKIYAICYDFAYPDLYIFRGVDVIKEFSSIDDAKAFMRAQLLDITK
jgi:hypothetical protein